MQKRQPERLPRGVRERLARRAQRAGLELGEALLEGLLSYYRLLWHWNRRINLTGIADVDEAIDRLLLEPVAAARLVSDSAEVAVDVGSGGGSPAIPMKLARPDLRLTLVESKTRKAAFLREAVRNLGLSGTAVESVRYEELLARPEFHEVADVVTVRALRIRPRGLLDLQTFLKPGGWILLFRGEEPQASFGPIPPGMHHVGTFPLAGLRAQVLVLEKRPSR